MLTAFWHVTSPALPETAQIRTVEVSSGRGIPTLPATLAGQPGTLHQRVELGPGDRRVDLRRAGKRREATVGAGDDPLAADHAGEPPEPLGHQLGVLHEYRRLGDDAGDQYLV